MASLRRTTGTGWLPFRSERVLQQSPDACQPLGPGPNGEPEQLCERAVQMSYDPNYVHPSQPTESDWQKYPSLRWDVWGEIQQRLSDVGPIYDPTNSRVPAIPQSVQAPRQLLDWETNTPSQSYSLGDASVNLGASNLLCELDPACFVPKCSCDGVDCMT